MIFTRCLGGLSLHPQRSPWVRQDKRTQRFQFLVGDLQREGVGVKKFVLPRRFAFLGEFRYRKIRSIAKNHPKPRSLPKNFLNNSDLLFTEGFRRNSPQKVHPNFAQNLGRQILGHTIPFLASSDGTCFVGMLSGMSQIPEGAQKVYSADTKGAGKTGGGGGARVVDRQMLPRCTGIPRPPPSNNSGMGQRFGGGGGSWYSLGPRGWGRGVPVGPRGVIVFPWP